MSPMDSIRSRLRSLPDQLLSALTLDNEQAASSVEGVSQAWITLVGDVDSVSKNQPIDEDTAELLGYVASLIHELSGAYLDFETQVCEARSTYRQELDNILHDTSPALVATNPIPNATFSSDEESMSSVKNISMEAPYRWLLRHIHKPYPTKSELAMLAHTSSITTAKLASFFKRTRERSGWSRIMRVYFGGNRSRIISTASKVFSSTSVNGFLSASVISNVIMGDEKTSALCLCEFMNYKDFLFSRLKKECLPSVVDDTASDWTTESDTHPLQVDSFQRDPTEIDPSCSEGYGDTQFNVNILSGHRISLHDHVTHDAQRPNRKRARSISPLSSDNTNEFSSVDSQDEDAADSSLRSAKRTKVNAIESTSSAFSSKFTPIEHRGTTPLSRLNARSMPDLRPSVLAQLRCRRNSETAATAPWPLPAQTELQSLFISPNPESSAPLSHMKLATASSNMFSYSLPESVADNTNGSPTWLDFGLASAEEAVAALHQQLDVPVDVTPCDPSMFDFIPATDFWDFDSCSGYTEHLTSPEYFALADYQEIEPCATSSITQGLRETFKPDLSIPLASQSTSNTHIPDWLSSFSDTSVQVCPTPGTLFDIPQVPKPLEPTMSMLSVFGESSLHLFDNIGKDSSILSQS